MTSARATAAKGTFPYPHRTVAEVDKRVAKWADDLAPPSAHYAWCAQCDRRVQLEAAAGCKSMFCQLRMARAA